jgi:hypothetical protein
MIKIYMKKQKKCQFFGMIDENMMNDIRTSDDS